MLQNTTITTFFSQFPQEEFEKDEVIQRSGEKAPNLFFVEEGAVKMMTSSVEGTDLVLHIFYPGACFSLVSLATHQMNDYDFVALTDVKVRRAPAEQVEAFFMKNPEACFTFMLHLLRGLKGLVERIERSVFVSAYHQVAGLLVYYAKHFGETSGNTNLIRLRLTHQDIATWLGLSRENVSIQMKKLEKDGLICKARPFIEILDYEKLKKLADPTSSL